MSLRHCRFEHPKTERNITVGGWSYLWAGISAPDTSGGSVLVPLAVLTPGTFIISIIREGFRRRGWLIRVH